MRLNQFVFLLASTVIVGALGGFVSSTLGIWLHLPWYIGLIAGALLATTTLMGFWAYLTLNFIASVSLPRRVWRWAQALILAVVVYDMLWWRFHIDAVRHPLDHPHATVYLVQGLWPLLIAFIAAYVKRRMSGRGSFLPSVFYLYVFTVIDWLLVIRVDSGSIANETGAIMMLCNVYLLLIYGKLLSPATERAAWADEAQARIQQKALMKQARAKARVAKKAKRTSLQADESESSTNSASLQ